ncbi:uncharacterized protein LOC120352822 [Nilaparvata lugens]|uniref:uncharacterized protein LOC120352822 n=1 Tax=Nilaparvata lugens TaxID=108931 RepID=UPI00193E2421|nr:uncharacterized protein LOC120352822 [Nilaparvata lugens]
MGIPMREEHLFTLCFADDQVVIAQDEEDLSYMMRRLNEEYKDARLEINLDKTEYLQTNSEVTQNLKVDDDVEIKGTDKFKYLVYTITQNGGTDEEIKRRLGQTRSCIRQLHTIIWSKSIHRKTKQMIFLTIVRSIMTYGAEVWVTNKRSRGKILTVKWSIGEGVAGSPGWIDYGMKRLGTE